MAEVRTYLKTSGRQGTPSFVPLSGGRGQVKWNGTDGTLLSSEIFASAAEAHGFAEALKRAFPITTTSTSTTTTTTSSPTVSSPAGWTLTWNEDFNYPAGTPLPADSFDYDPTGYDYAARSPSYLKNAYCDGQGNLLLRVMREPAGVLNHENPRTTEYFSGIQFATFLNGQSWPPPSVKRRFRMPFALECRYLAPAWGGIYYDPMWLMPVNRPTSTGMHEVDVCENTSALTTKARCYQHKWQYGKDLRSTSLGTLDVPDQSRNWTTVRVEMRVAGPKVYVNGTRVGTDSTMKPIDDMSGSPDPSQEFGFIATAHMATSSSSFFNGGVTVPAAEWNQDFLKVDYYRAWSIPA